ncbi:MAG: hypothetical protein IJA61_01860 [Clostridia bacterium]|nr:hypothetical protein [Clostridia bacterium]
MKKIKKYFKNLFSKKVNIVLASLIGVIVIMMIIPIRHEYYIKTVVGLIAISMFVVAFKFFQKYKEEKKRFEAIECQTQESRNIFKRMSSGIRSIDYKSHKVSAILFIAFGLMFIVYIFIK